MCDSRATHSSSHPSQPERFHITNTRYLIRNVMKLGLHRRQRFSCAPPTHTNPHGSQPSPVFTCGGARGRGVGGHGAAPTLLLTGLGVWLCRQPSRRDPGFPHQHAVSCLQRSHHTRWPELCHTLIFSMLFCLWDIFYLSGNWTSTDVAAVF